MFAAPNFNIKTSKSILVEYGDGTYEFVKPENFYKWKYNMTEELSKNKNGLNIVFSDYASKILFNIE